MQRIIGLALLATFSAAFPSPAADIAWTNVGPGGGGWIQAIACDPRDPDTIYLGCDVGGFYISRDAGRSWHIQNEGLNNYFVECIAVHPADSKILLLGMEGGIFKSIDQGRTWAWKRRGLPPPERYSYSARSGPCASIRAGRTSSSPASAGRDGPRTAKGESTKAPIAARVGNLRPQKARSTRRPSSAT